MELTESEGRYLLRKCLVDTRKRDDSELEKLVMAAWYHIREAESYRDKIRYYLEDDGLYVVRIDRKTGEIVDEVKLPYKERKYNP